MSQHKGKTTASVNAQVRAQNENHLSKAPAVTQSDKDVDQRRAVDETALSGVDRPSGRPLDKHDGREGTVGTGRTSLSPAQQSVRRAQGVSDHAE